MSPWIDRKKLIRDAKDFASKNGYFLRSHAKRISGLVEMAVYHSIVEYYHTQGYSLATANLGPKKSFKYKSSPTGLLDNFSSFTATHPSAGYSVWILPNTKVQSAHHKHLYYTPDVVVCVLIAAVTKEQQGGKRHSYVENSGLLTFIEVKHLTPFPEVLFSFTGLVQEFAPHFISGMVPTSLTASHLTPVIVFTGAASKHVRTIQKELETRYGINIIYNTQGTRGQIANTKTLLKYDPPIQVDGQSGTLIASKTDESNNS
jgi:hypothetical protein